MDLPLFDGFDTPARAERRPSSRPTWSQYRPKGRVPCDDCLAELVQAGGGPLARAARWRRVQAGVDRLLCTAHAQEQREADGLARLKDT